MVLIFFFLAILVVTWTQHIWISLCMLLVVLWWRIVVGYYKKANLKIILWQALIVFLLVFASITRKEVVYHNTMQHLTSEFIGTGEIVSRVDEDTYEISMSDTLYRYQSQMSYVPWVILWTTGNFRPWLQHSMWLDSRETSLTTVSLAESLTRCWMVLINREFDYPLWMKMKGYYGVVYETTAIPIGQAPRWVRDRVRGRLVQWLLVHWWESKTSALILGMLIGDRSLLGKENYESFIASGLVHIIAVSGWNIVMLVVFLSAVLFFMPFYIRLVVLVCCILFFSFVVWPDSSVIRATLMGVLVLVALFSGRRMVLTRSLGLVAVVMLLINPYYLLYDIGFVFSFSAVLGLAKSWAYRWERKCHYSLMPLQKLWNAYLLPSIGASVWVLPFVLFFVGSFNIVSLLANVIVLPIAPLVMVGGFFVVVFSGWAGQLVWLLSHMVEYIFRVSTISVRYGRYVYVHEAWYMIVIIPYWLWWLLTKETKKPDRVRSKG